MSKSKEKQKEFEHYLVVTKDLAMEFKRFRKAFKMCESFPCCIKGVYGIKSIKNLIPKSGNIDVAFLLSQMGEVSFGTEVVLDNMLRVHKSNVVIRTLQ